MVPTPTPTFLLQHTRTSAHEYTCAITFTHTHVYTRILIRSQASMQTYQLHMQSDSGVVAPIVSATFLALTHRCQCVECVYVYVSVYRYIGVPVYL
eukprot:m.300269 g.300269  ORF g.300269 m.300269 type:complete len:96 (-) comp20126_c1_seq2:1943-2230(-)